MSTPRPMHRRVRSWLFVTLVIAVAAGCQAPSSEPAPQRRGAAPVLTAPSPPVGGDDDDDGEVRAAVSHDDDASLRLLGGDEFGRLTALTFSPDSRSLVTTDIFGHVRQWDLSAPSASHPIAEVVHGRDPGAVDLAIQHDGHLALADMHGEERLWPTPPVSSTVESRCPPGEPNCTHRAVAVTASYVYTVDGDTLRVWSPDRESPIDTLELGRDDVVELVVGPDDRHVAARFRGGVLFIDRVAERQHTIECPDDTHRRAHDVSVHAGHIVHQCGVDVWTFAVADREWPEIVHRRLVSDTTRVRYAPQGDAVAVMVDTPARYGSAAERRVELWSVDGTEQTLAHTIDGRTGALVAWSPDGRLLALADAHAQRATVYATDDARVVGQWPPLQRTGPGHGAAVDHIELSDDGRTAVTYASEVDALVVWDLETHRAVQRLPLDARLARDVALSPTGDRLAVALSNDVLFYVEGDMGYEHDEYAPGRVELWSRGDDGRYGEPRALGQAENTRYGEIDFVGRDQLQVAVGRFDEDAGAYQWSDETLDVATGRVTCPASPLRTVASVTDRRLEVEVAGESEVGYTRPLSDFGRGESYGVRARVWPRTSWVELADDDRRVLVDVTRDAVVASYPRSIDHLVDVSYDGQLLVLTDRRARALRVVGLASTQPPALIEVRQGVTAVRFDPAGRRLFVARRDGAVEVHDLRETRERLLVDSPVAPLSLPGELEVGARVAMAYHRDDPGDERRWRDHEVVWEVVDGDEDGQTGRAVHLALHGDQDAATGTPLAIRVDDRCVTLERSGDDDVGPWCLPVDSSAPPRWTYDEGFLDAEPLMTSTLTLTSRLGQAQWSARLGLQSLTWRGDEGAVESWSLRGVRRADGRVFGERVDVQRRCAWDQLRDRSALATPPWPGLQVDGKTVRQVQLTATEPGGVVVEISGRDDELLESIAIEAGHPVWLSTWEDTVVVASEHDGETRVDTFDASHARRRTSTRVYASPVELSLARDGILCELRVASPDTGQVDDRLWSGAHMRGSLPTR